MFLVPVSTGATLPLVRTLRAASTKPVIQLCGQHEPFWAKHGKGGEQADRLRPGSRACAFGTESCAVSGRGRRWRFPCPHAWSRGRSALSSYPFPTSSRPSDKETFCTGNACCLLVSELSASFFLLVSSYLKVAKMWQKGMTIGRIARATNR